MSEQQIATTAMKFWLEVDDGSGIRTELEAKTLDEAKEEAEKIIDGFNSQHASETQKTLIWTAALYSARTQEEADEIEYQDNVEEWTVYEHPSEPSCIHGEEHTWREQHNNYLEEQKCARCGLIKEEDYNATNMEDGTQGHNTIEYIEDETADHDEVAHEIRIYGADDEYLEQQIEQELRSKLEDLQEDDEEYLHRDWRVYVPCHEKGKGELELTADNTDDYTGSVESVELKIKGFVYD